MRSINVVVILFITILLFGCTVLLMPASVIRNSPIENFKYVYISPTKSLSSGAGGLSIGVNGIYGSTRNKTVNPEDVISGILTKKGFIRLPEIKSELNEETLIVNYGESGKRNTGFGGYTIEVTIQFITATSSELISSCTAEGQGQTEADDIREAITRCLKALQEFNPKIKEDSTERTNQTKLKDLNFIGEGFVQYSEDVKLKIGTTVIFELDSKFYKSIVNYKNYEKTNMKNIEEYKTQSKKWITSERTYLTIQNTNIIGYRP